MKNRLKKKDIVLMIIILVVAGSCVLLHRIIVAVLTFGLQLLKTTDEYSEVEIQVNGELYGRYRLEQDQEIDVNDKNKVLIKDRKVRMEDADCPDQICVNHRAISRDGESIICLPNQTVVTIRGGEEPEVDEIAR